MLTLEVTPDSRRAAAVGFIGQLVFVELTELTQPAEGPIDDLIAAGELAASQRIDANGGLVYLTSEEWLTR